MEKLRSMMDRLRQQAELPPVVVEEPAPQVQALAEAPAAEPAEAVPPVTTPTPPESAQDRFETLRAEVAPEAQHQPLDLAKVTDMIRLAGRRFPLVRYDDAPLPALPSRVTPRWTLPGIEILFGLGALNDRAYWKALAALTVTRLEELQAEATQKNLAATRLKIVVPKGEQDSVAWTTLLADGAFPPEIRQFVEPLHLDPRSIASLYATRRLITEAESGTLTVSPTHLMSIVTREMDFFWKRVTRSPA